MSSMIRTCTGLCLSLLLLAQYAAADELSDVRAFLDGTFPDDRPGASVLVARGGEIIHRSAHGLANVELGVPITVDTVFRIGSITKQFTAGAIMLLEQRGQLSVEDPIDKFLPDYPTNGHVITVEHLLTHTSGIRSYTGMPGYMGNPVRADLSTAELIDVFDNEPMEFAPGELWNYNNSGYVLLGAIIEAVSGQTYEEFIADNIATPLELERTFYGGPKIIPNRAAGYVQTDDERLENAAYLSMTQPHAAGSLLSTTGDLFAWHRALSGGEFIHDESFARMIRPYALNDGETYPYGYGLGLARLRGREIIAHGGGINGFTCFALWLPEDDIYVAVLTNRESFSPGPSTVAKKIAAMVIGDPYPPRVAVNLTEKDRHGLVGKYEGEHFPPIEISIVDGRMLLHVGDYATETLLAESREVLFWRDSLEYVEVVWDGGQARRLLFYSEEGVPPDSVERLSE